MKKHYSHSLVILGLISLWFFSTTADYSTLTKNTWDTLTATSWNQLVDNVKWIQTDSNGNVGIWTDTPWAKLWVTWNITSLWSASKAIVSLRSTETSGESIFQDWFAGLFLKNA